ncbi:MAG: riboflavin synthase [Polaribacter sp.]|jgi:riboflavin synthase
MFTGIIEAIGQIEAIRNLAGDAKIKINVGELDMSDVAIGDSIACNGVCLTAIEFSKNHYMADVSSESLRLTTLGDLKIGSFVNLEKALTPTTRLGGHLVSGHVDGVGKVISVEKDARSVIYKINAPKEIAHYIAKKGSICVDGVSLTVNEVENTLFSLNLVPHTLNETTAENYKVGSHVNLEVDLLARYLERLLTGQKIDSSPDTKSSKITPSTITKAFLSKNGF